MKKILIFAGTTEGRQLSDWLCERQVQNTVCVATEYGEIVLKDNPCRRIQVGRKNAEEMRNMIREESYEVVIDATHPFAELVTEQIQEAVEGLNIVYYRLLRETEETVSYRKMRFFENHSSCAEALEKMDGNILLTTGSKDLQIYNREALKGRLYARVLPSVESLSLCQKAGIAGKQVLALQGPFSVEMNTALIRQYGISCMVTKESGKSGGFTEKIEAAKQVDIPVYVIGRPAKEEGYYLEELCQKLEEIYRIPSETISEPAPALSAERNSDGIAENGSRLPQIFLAGIGMGSSESMTVEVQHVIREADILLGAERMIADYEPRIEKKPYYLAKQIVPYIKEMLRQKEVQKIVILFSGDSGFYSGCQKLICALNEEIACGNIQADVQVLPGISSISYLVACLGESYQDAVLSSIHGKDTTSSRWKSEILEAVCANEKVFLLLSGSHDVKKLGALLTEANMEHCTIYLGYRLSYPDQCIQKYTPEECMKLEDAGLYTCMIKNPYPVRKRLSYGTADSEFLRDAVPMTKEEVREVSISKLKLHEQAVVYDVGSGSGSVAVEIAGISHNIQVYAIERKPEAVSLIRKNQEKFHAYNMDIIEAYAPDGLESLPVPTHAFLGGTGGKLKEILDCLYRKNSHMRIVINAVTLETISEIREVLAHFPVTDESMVQLQVSRTRKAGSYHLIQAENPVWICAFTFCSQEPEDDKKEQSAERETR